MNCPTCGELHEICPRCKQHRVVCPPDEPGEPFAWCERCENQAASWTDSNGNVDAMKLEIAAKLSLIDELLSEIEERNKDITDNDSDGTTGFLRKIIKIPLRERKHCAFGYLVDVSLYNVLLRKRREIKKGAST